MSYRVLPLFLVALALAVFVSAPMVAGEKDEKGDKNTHVGKFVSASGNDFKMTDKKGDKEHAHTLAADAKVIGAEGKEGKLDELKAGQMIRVTTKEGDPKTATKVEVLKEKDKDK